MTDSPLQVDQLVTHTRKHEWGVGKVQRIVGDKAVVFFADAGLHNGARQNPVTVLTSFLEPSRLKTHPALDNLTRPQGNVTAGKDHITIGQAKAAFLRRFPKGFEDPKYLEKERNYKWEAHRECRRVLGRSVLNGLLASQDYVEIAKRALRVVGLVNLPTPWDHMALRDGLRAAADQRRFAFALRDLLHGDGPEEPRFTAFAQTLDSLPQKQARVLTWPNQTIFLFLWDPRRQMFMKPGVTKRAAMRRAFDLHYRQKPNWDTYSQLLTLAALLFESLADLGPRDNIDVQSFVWLIGGR